MESCFDPSDLTGTDLSRMRALCECAAEGLSVSGYSLYFINNEMEQHRYDELLDEVATLCLQGDPTWTTSTAAPTTVAPTATVTESVGERNARETAASYLEYSAFSRSGLIDQLEYEGFTTTQAEYGVNAVGY